MNSAPMAAAGGRTVVMQPYLFPYIGYFQLIHACDRFVLLDDAAFIRQGWVNRNRILLNGSPHTFTVPLSGQSSFASIRETRVLKDNGWKRKLLATIDQAYRKAQGHGAVMAVVERVLMAGDEDIAAMAERSLRECMNAIGIHRPLLRSSGLGVGMGLKAQSRVIALCEAAGTTMYINAPGGRALYDAEAFRSHGMDLRFLQPGSIRYAQGKAGFIGDLSIIDALMWNTPEQVRALLGQYTLEP